MLYHCSCSMYKPWSCSFEHFCQGKNMSNMFKIWWYLRNIIQAQKLKVACPQGEMISEIKWSHLLTISGFSMFLILNFVQKQLTIFYMPYDFEWQKVMNGLSSPYLLIKCVVWRKRPRCWKYGYYQRAPTLLEWFTCKKYC